MDNGEISVTQALNQIQSWLNAGEFDKVIQGCQEILQIEAGNQRALMLLKQAEERRHEKIMNTPKPEPKPEPPAPAPAADPLSELKVETETPKPEEESNDGESINLVPERDPRPDNEKRNLFLAILIPAILVVLIGGGAIWAISNQDREETIDEVIGEERPDVPYTEANEERLEVLTGMSTVLETYKIEHGAYPSLEQVESILEDSKEFDEVPSDPRHGDFDKAGKMFGYLYAVYDSSKGDNQVYIISALFEDSKGFGYAWTRGASTKNYDGYRDLSNEYVTFIGGEAKENDGPKVKVKR